MKITVRQLKQLINEEVKTVKATKTVGILKRIKINLLQLNLEHLF